MNTQTIDSELYRKMIISGAANLKKHANEINDLNVFPIPDGDTGDNMLLTVTGGANAEISGGIGTTARQIADGMLLSARGNSGVILSQFFDGIATYLDSENLSEAGPEHMKHAVQEGVNHAYRAVLTPTEGTILTVVREASEYAYNQNSEFVDEYMSDFLYEANNSLTRTPDLLPVLKKAGVVDSGGAGLICIVEGMRSALTGEVSEFNFETPAASTPKVDIDKFTADSQLEFGYCTEVLLRLQNAKTDVEAFEVTTITDYLQTIGDSVVAFKTGTAVKIHVHTMTPDKVLAFCQQFGEFLTLKIENMSLQHNSLDQEKEPSQKERQKYAVITVACGEGMKNMFYDLGANFVINGGQSMNPSTKDFLDAFDKVNADTIFVFPNNGNIILTAEQASKMYAGSEIHVLKSKTLGEGHAALSMMDLECGSTEEILENIEMSMSDVITAAISTCSRDTEADDLSLYKGEYIGFVGGKILSADNDRVDTAKRLIDSIDFGDHEICILLTGKDADAKETEEVRKYLKEKHPMCELYEINGGQDVYHYVLIVE